MRISDWSSDVCSSDLDHAAAATPEPAQRGLVHGQPVVRRRGAADAARAGARGACGIQASVGWVERSETHRLHGIPAGRWVSLRSTHPTSHGLRGMTASMERSEEHTSDLQSLMRISYAVFCLKKKK